MFRRLVVLVAPVVLTALTLAFSPRSATAQLRVDVSGVGAQQAPLSINRFETSASVRMPGAAPEAVIAANFSRTGLFDVRPSTAAPEAAALRALGTDWAVTGKVDMPAVGRYVLSYQLWDNVRGQAVLSGQAGSSAEAWRHTLHTISDELYQKITGERGAFASRIAYVSVASGQRADKYKIYVAQSDGLGGQVAVSSPLPLMSPAWSPDGQRLAYVSFESQKSVVYVHDLRSGQRREVANFRGNNSAPAWLPSGNELVVSLSRDAVSQLYVVNAQGGGAAPRRISQSNAIDTEAAVSADGRSLYFVSDRGGSPQVYVQALSGGAAQRITFAGDYNISPAVSSLQNAETAVQLAYVARSAGGYSVQLMDLATGSTQGAVQRLGNTRGDERPSFAPNGRMVLYSSGNARASQLWVASSNGRATTPLNTGHDARDAAWEP